MSNFEHIIAYTPTEKEYLMFSKEPEVLSVNRNGWVATYHGGEYIEVGRDRSTPVDVINVWDYELGKSTIEYSRKAVGARLALWVREVSQDWIDNGF